MRSGGSSRLNCDDGLFGLKWLRNCVGSFLAASVAQLDRASDFGSEGYRFKSCRTRHLSGGFRGFFQSLLQTNQPSSIKSSNRGDFEFVRFTTGANATRERAAIPREIRPPDCFAILLTVVANQITGASLTSVLHFRCRSVLREYLRFLSPAVSALCQCRK